jgi:hypothetical protein
MFTSDKGPSNTRPLRKPNRLHTIRAKQHKSKLALFLPPQQSIYMVLILSFLFSFSRGTGGHHENSVIASSTDCAPVARWIERRPGNMEGIKSGCTWWWWWLFCRVTLCYCCTGCARCIAIFLLALTCLLLRQLESGGKSPLSLRWYGPAFLQNCTVKLRIVSNSTLKACMRTEQPSYMVIHECHTKYQKSSGGMARVKLPVSTTYYLDNQHDRQEGVQRY